MNGMAQLPYVLWLVYHRRRKSQHKSAGIYSCYIASCGAVYRTDDGIPKLIIRILRLCDVNYDVPYAPPVSSIFLNVNFAIGDAKAYTTTKTICECGLAAEEVFFCYLRTLLKYQIQYTEMRR